MMTAAIMMNNSNHCNSIGATIDGLKLAISFIILVNVAMLISYSISIFYWKDKLSDCDMTNITFTVFNGSLLFVYLVIKLAELL